MDKNLEYESTTIDWLRFPMAAMVVLLHTGSLGCDSTFPLYSSLCILLPNGICRIAVPMFFLFSGYFFFKGFESWNWSLYWEKIKKRTKSLFVPYILWNIIAALLIYSYNWLRMNLNGAEVISLTETIKDWGGLRIFWDCDKGLPLDYPLWFIRNLYIIVLCSPVIYLIIKHLKIFGILALLLLHIFYGSFASGLFFFSAGGFIRIRHDSILNIALKGKTISYILAPLLLIAILVFYHRVPSSYKILVSLFVVVGIIALFNLVFNGISSGRLKTNPFLSKSSFFIFATHGILILHEFAHFIVLHCIPFKGEAYYCTDLFVRPVIAIAICLGLFWFLDVTFPRLLALITGGRINRRLENK